MLENNLEVHVDMAAVKGGKGNPIFFEIPKNINLKMDDISINKDVFTALCYNMYMSQVGTTAAKTGQALNKLARALNEQNQRWEYTTEKLPELVDKINAIGCVNPAAPEEISQGLLRAETLGASEIPNENISFNFLEQSAYDKSKNFLDGDNYWWLTPLDTI